MRGTVPATLTELLVRAAGFAGIDRGELLRGAGLDEAALGDPEGRVPYDAQIRLWELITQREGLEGFGLRLGSLSRAQDLGVVGYALLHARNVGEAQERLTRFRRLIHDVMVPSLGLVKGKAVLQQVFPPEVVRLRQPAEASMAGALGLFRAATGVHWQPEEVVFQHPAPRDLQLHREIFGCTPRFCAKETRMVFDAALLTTPNLAPDPQLSAHLLRHAEMLHARLPPGTALVDEVRRLVADELRGGDPSQERVARRLALSTRTLQRRLRDEGTTFFEIVEHVRGELSKIYLTDSGMTLHEVAFLLGFTEVSAFFRAFRRWTGRTPQAYRTAQRDGRSTGQELADSGLTDAAERSPS